MTELKNLSLPELAAVLTSVTNSLTAIIPELIEREAMEEGSDPIMDTPTTMMFEVSKLIYIGKDSKNLKTIASNIIEAIVQKTNNAD
jgi:hypothetical protein